MDNNRPTATLKTTGGHEVVYKTYINKLEERKILEIYLRNADASTDAKLSTGRIKFEADDAAFEAVIESMDDSKENIIARVLELPTAEYNEIANALKDVIDPKKN